VFVNITDNAASGSDKYAATGRARARAAVDVRSSRIKGRVGKDNYAVRERQGEGGVLPACKKRMHARVQRGMISHAFEIRKPRLALGSRLRFFTRNRGKRSFR